LLWGRTTGLEFTDALNQIPVGEKVTVGVNSQGGYIGEGLAIFNAIARRSEDVTVRIDGYALSIASFFPLAASKVVSPKTSVWMTHYGWSGTQGNAKDHRKSADMLDTHDNVLVSEYRKKTGKSEKQIRDMLDAETWMTGEEAIQFGLADEEGANEPDLSALDFSNATADTFKCGPSAALLISRCKNIAPEIQNALRPVAVNDSAAPGGGQQNQNKQENQMNKKLIVALLKKHGIEALETESETELQAKLDKIPAAVAAPAPQPTNVVPVSAEEFKAEKRRRVRAEVVRLGENKIPNDKIDVWTDRAIAGKEDEIYAEIVALNVANVGGDGLSFNRLETVIDGVDFGTLTGPKSAQLVNLRKENKTIAGRVAAMRDSWKSILDSACKLDVSKGREVFAANTYSGTLVTSFLMDGSITNLQNVWAMLKAFSLDSSTDPYKPLATGVLKNVTAGATTQTDATNFESGNSTVAPVSVTMHQYSQSFQVSNTDLNSGLRMQDLVTINTANFANKIIEVATVPMTTAIFSTTPLTSAAAAFGFSDLATLQGQLKKSAIKNLILDGTYIARIANSPAFFQQTGVVGGNPGAWKAFGWDLIAQNTDWTGAGANVQGFACNPQAIAGITGLPLTPPNIPGGIFSTTTATVPGLEISYMLSTWFNPATRTMWSGMDIMAGFKEVDTTAGFIIKSA
jgi:ATP-dependent protease ClpP protease subunit